MQNDLFLAYSRMNGVVSEMCFVAGLCVPFPFTSLKCLFESSNVDQVLDGSFVIKSLKCSHHSWPWRALQ